MVSDPPLLFHRCFELLAALVVEDLEVNRQVLVFEPLHNEIIRSDAVFVHAGRKRFKQNDTDCRFSPWWETSRYHPCRACVGEMSSHTACLGVIPRLWLLHFR